ncbi:MAG: DEAD/DEAH box helicase, partial [Verrucomicrobiota bacterium]
CVLKEVYPGSTSEICAVEVQARSLEGKPVELWDGYWSAVGTTADGTRRDEEVDGTRALGDPAPHAGGSKGGGGKITLYDRSAMRDPRSLLLGLDAKWEAYQRIWSLRVTKKFPEIFATWLKSIPPDVKVELKGDLASFLDDTVAGSVRLDVTETEMDWFDLRVVLDVADTTLTQEELKLLLNARGRYVRLGEKGWRRLQFNLTGEEDEKLARLGLSPRELSAEPQRLHALQLADSSAKKFLSSEQFEKIERRAAEIKTRVTPDLPSTVTATLRPYQLEGFHFLAYLAENRFGGILADDMGLGKTVQTLAWLAWLRGRVEVPVGKIRNQPSLVVCPKSVMDNWRVEVERFTPGLRVKAWSAGELDQLADRLGEADLHVLNYSQLRLAGEALAPVRWLAVILDEGQYIKNPSSQTAQVARSLNAQHRLILSGTPIENRLLDLWSLMAFAMPGVLGSRAQFSKLYDAKEDPFARRRLSARVRPFLLRRTKAQVAKDLPDRTEEDLFCEIEGEQRTLYRAELKRAQQMLLRITTQKQLAKERFHFLTSLLRLRQICCHPRLVKPDSTAPSAKVESLLEQLEPLMEEGHKVLVFSQFVEMLDILREEISPRGWPSFYLSGATENRGELVQQFQSAEGAAVFLISLKAGGFGLNLTAASYVVLFDPWWNPAVENQAIDRTHRIGQTRNVMAYRLLIKSSIEEKIRLLQKTKSSLAEDVLGEEKFAQSLTLNDLQFLLSDSE